MRFIEEYFVYQHVNKTNGKRYIGITKQHPEQRWGRNGVNYKECPHFWSVINKYGWDSFEHDVLYSGLSKEEACRIECELIKTHNTQDREFGYNVMSGGTAPSIPDEVRRKMSVSMRGNKNGAGKVCSEEKKKKISDAQKGKTLTEEHRANISKAKRGKTHKTLSKESRQKIADSHEKKAVFCQELNRQFPSIQECARELGLYATNICKCCKNKIKTTGGFHFYYIDNNT